MSVDDSRNWKHAEQIERGEAPEQDTAQFKLATLLAEHDDIHTIHHQMVVAGRVLAFLPRIQAWAAAEQQPKGPGPLRQQPVLSLSDEDFFAEQAHYHLKGYREAMGVLVAMGSPYAKDYDPDERGADEDSERISLERADDKRSDAMPKGLAS